MTAYSHRVSWKMQKSYWKKKNKKQKISIRKKQRKTTIYLWRLKHVGIKNLLEPIPGFFCEELMSIHSTGKPQNIENANKPFPKQGEKSTLIHSNIYFSDYNRTKIEITWMTAKRLREMERFELSAPPRATASKLSVKPLDNTPN